MGEKIWSYNYSLALKVFEVKLCPNYYPVNNAC